jgi:hypothetical protein
VAGGRQGRAMGSEDDRAGHPYLMHKSSEGARGHGDTWAREAN